MGNPLIVYDRPLGNPSFELGTPGGVPTSWTEVGFGGIAQIIETDFFNRGSLEGKRCLQIRLDSGSEILRQDLLSFYRMGSTLWLFFMARVDSVQFQSLRMRIADLNGAGAELGATQQSFTPGTGWSAFIMSRAQSNASGVGTRVEIEARVVGSTVFVDYLQLGRAVDFDRGFISFHPREDVGRQINLGSGAYEAVELGDPASRFVAEWGSVTEGSALDLQIHAFREWAGANRTFAFWLDRTMSRNEDLHFGDCIADPEFLRGIPAGPRRYLWQLPAEAPKEWIAQAA